MDTQQKCGYVAILGRPNAGKSTLLNALVGDKVAVVSRKPQTTRNRILGVTIQGDAQILFLDTPGLHKDKGRNLINSMMNRVALQVAAEADLLLYLIDVTEGFRPEDATFLSRVLGATSAPFVLLASKADSGSRDERGMSVGAALMALERFFDEEGNRAFKQRMLTEDPVQISAKRAADVAELKEFMADQLPEGPWLFEADDMTDMPQAFLCAELIREQVFRQLGQEIPYGTAVKVTALETKPDIVVVRAQILAGRKSHKPILLGKGGTRIKALGMAARESLERHFGQRVFLDLSVGVMEGWIDDQRLIAELAHMQDFGGGGEIGPESGI